MNSTENLDSLFPAAVSRYSVVLRDVLLAYQHGRETNLFSLLLPKLEVQAGSIRCIYGTNGCGKTTLLRALAGVVHPREGEITWAPHTSPRLGVDLVLVTQAGPMPHWSVQQNIRAPMLNHGLDEKQVETRTSQLVQLLGLDGLEARYAHQLSAGQQQRTVLARALSVAPKVLLLDEIMSGQSEYWAARIGEILRFYAAQGAMIVLVSHDPEWVLSYGDSVSQLISNHTDAVSTTRFYIGYDGPANMWQAYRETRYGKQHE